MSVLPKMVPTEFWKHYEVFGIALRAGNTCCAVTPLLLVNPSLQAGLVNPFSGATAATWTHPFCCAVILICGEAHPTAPKNKQTHTYR